MAATNSAMEAKNEVDDNESSNNSKDNMNNIPRRTSREDRSASSLTRRKTRTAIICGDSMVMELKRSYGKGEQMRTYCKQSIEKKPNCLIIHCGTKYLKKTNRMWKCGQKPFLWQNRWEHNACSLSLLDKSQEATTTTKCEPEQTSY